MREMNMMTLTVALLGTVACVGCSAKPEPIESRSSAVTDTVRVSAGGVVLAPGRPHDVSSADLDGTVQFKVVSAPAGSLEQLIAPAIRYTRRKGGTIASQAEVSAIKGTDSLIVTVRASAPLDLNERYTLQVEQGRGVQVSDAARTGSDGIWRMHLYTGSDPQVVAMREDGGRIYISFSEPVDVQNLNLAIASKGALLQGCFETSVGCVSKVDASEVTEEVSFRHTKGAVHEDLEVNMTGPNAGAIAAVRLQKANWALDAVGARSWQRPVAD